MSIAEKLKRAKDDLDAVYAAGKAAGGGDNPLQYATQFLLLFYKAVFPPSESKLSLNLPKCESLKEAFRLASGLEKVSLTLSTDKAINVSYCFYVSSSGYSNLAELAFPAGLKVSNFSYFAHRNQSLMTISGSIDLSESTDNACCFEGCTDLVDVRFATGTITKSISFAQSAKLSDASITSIINGLSVYAEGQTLTVHPDVAARIIETDVTDAGWTLAY